MARVLPTDVVEAEKLLKQVQSWSEEAVEELVEWTCIQAVNPHLDWPLEQTVGTYVDVSHEAATPPGVEIVVEIGLVEVDGRRLVFDVKASDGVDIIGRGTHERFVIDAERFSQRVIQKKKTGQQYI